MKNILFVASESTPFIKTGGLADVVGSLPKCFDKKKYDVRVMIPKYACIPDEWKNKMVYKTHFYIDLAWRKQYVGIMELQHNGITFYFIDNEFILQDQNHTVIYTMILRSLHFFARLHCHHFQVLIFIRMLFNVMTGRQDSFLYIFMICFRKIRSIRILRQ